MYIYMVTTPENVQIPMSKVKNSSRNITPFGGLNFVFAALSKLNINGIIEKKLGFRAANAKYSYTDIITSLFASTLSQGSVLSDVETLNSKLEGQGLKKLPSADTIEYACQELKSDTVVVENGKVIHEFNFNNTFNRLLICIALKTKQLYVNTTGYILDYDNVVLPNEKQDSKYTYKKIKGYHPGFATIGRIPVHLENHNGNTPAKYEQESILGRLFFNLRAENVKIKYFRADSASFQASVINLVEKETDFFFIRNMTSEGYENICNEVKDWKQIRVGYKTIEVASIEYQPSKCNSKYRVVVTRSNVNKGQTNVFTGKYTYYGIITNNKVMTEQEVIEFYNQRGDSENTNKNLLNDFNLNHLPFPDMDTNTVYMYFQCISAILFEWFKRVLVDNNTPKIKENMRTKAICFNYITVAAEYIKNKTEQILIVYSTQNYQHLKV